jgi:hypothetical protein
MFYLFKTLEFSETTSEKDTIVCGTKKDTYATILLGLFGVQMRRGNGDSLWPVSTAMEAGACLEVGDVGMSRSILA